MIDLVKSTMISFLKKSNRDSFPTWISVCHSRAHAPTICSGVVFFPLEILIVFLFQLTLIFL